MNTPATRLVGALEATEVSQAELARRLGVNPATVSHWVTGRRELSLKRIALIAKALGVEPQSLAFQGGAAAPPKPRRARKVTATRTKAPGTARARGAPATRKAAGEV